MIEILGNYSLSAAVLVAIGAILSSIAAVRFRSEAYVGLTRWCIAALALLFTISSAALVTAFIRSEFQFQYVLGHSELALPLGYKLAAFWAGQEGSLLLWAWMLSILCLCAVIGFRKWRGTDHTVTLATMAVVCGFFAALMLYAANPFALVDGQVPADGRGLNPMLQDPGMIIHPPLLFMGYAGYTIPFAVLIGVLVAGRKDNRWISLIRRWLLLSWGFLTAGIVLGAWWAYVELGWGGYWAWDPVENASILPWLTSTALLHSIIVHQHRGMFKLWNASLIALSFILCIFGTYLTRSGIISSVHAFAPSLVGTFFLAFLCISVLGSAALILWRFKALRGEHELDGLISREGAFLAGNVLLLIMTATTLVGTVFPLISSVFIEEPVAAKPAFYNKVVVPMAVLLVFVMAHGPVLAFGKTAASKIARAMVIPGITGFIAALAVAAWLIMGSWPDSEIAADLHAAQVKSLLINSTVSALVTFIAVLGTVAVIVGFLRSVAARIRSTNENPLIAAARLLDRDHRRYGGQLAHLGMMMVVIGVAASSLFPNERLVNLEPGETVEVGGYGLTLERLEYPREVNYEAVQATLTLTDSSGTIATLTPQKRAYNKWREQINTEIDLRSDMIRDIYVLLDRFDFETGSARIQVLITPLVLWIWVGGIVIVVGSLFCILPQLLAKSRRPEAVAAADSEQAESEPLADTNTVDMETNAEMMQ